MTVLPKSPFSSLVALTMAVALALSGCGDGEDDDGGSGYTDTTEALDQNDSATTTAADPGY